MSVIFLNHLGATLDNCDPRIMDGLAVERHIIAFDNRGVGATGGTTPETVAEMAKDAIALSLENSSPSGTRNSISFSTEMPMAINRPGSSLPG